MEPDADAEVGNRGGKTKEDWLVVHAQDSIESLKNQVEEMEALSVALSTCLDNLAEEVTVCHGLLLTDTAAGASLASHVKFLKDLTEERADALDLYQEKWTHAEQEWLLYASRVGHSCDDANGRIDLLPTQAYNTTGSMSNDNHVNANQKATTRDSSSGQTEEEEKEWKKKELMGQLANKRQKVKKLRASITDLAEELSSNLEQVERRGLSGGINLTRTLRLELREVEFQLAQAKSGEAICRTKLRQLKKTHINSTNIAGGKNNSKNTPPPAVMEDDTTSTLGNSAVEESDSTEEEEEETTPYVQVETGEEELEEQASEGEERGGNDSPVSHSSSTVESFEQVSIQDGIGDDIIPENKGDEMETEYDMSAAIASGNSVALTIRGPGKRGYLSFGLWELLGRIIGFGSESARKSAHQIHQSSSPVMIV
eukprot:scaffold110619_cov51-Attheya_sp.AAC.1